MAGINNKHRKRAFVMLVLLSVGFMAVFFRLADIMLINHDWYLQKARGQQTRKEIIPVKRGVIMDRRGHELAINLETESIFCDPAEVTSANQVARTLSLTIHKNEGAIYAKLVTNKHFSWVERKMADEKARQVQGMQLKGVGLVTEMKRVYPKGALASHVVGFVNLDNKGIEGVEKVYEKYLTAKEGSTYVVRDAKGNSLSEGSTKDIRGNDVVLTIDEGLQYILEKNLDAAMIKWRAVAATAIMMDPFTGEIFALANRPNFDPSELSQANPSEIRNRAITDCYEPGSTFKIVVGIAALEEKVVNPETRFDCSAGSIEVGGRRIKDDHKHGVLAFREVIQKSSNVGTIKTALMVGKSKVYEYIKKFGFGDKTGIDLQGEIPGLVKSPDRWSGTSIGAMAIGQEIAVTPLQVLRAYSAVANGGYLVTPHVVKEIRSPDGVIISKIEPKTQRIISAETAATFRGILKTVTEEGGTATEAAVEGNQVAGKTGTAQLFDQQTKHYSKTRYIGSFVGFVPADNPRLAIIVVIKEPKGQIYGGIVAGPVFRQIANEALSYLTVPMDNAMDKGLLLVKK
ncbi:MAG: peptidoglycan D,D-transpeptidase FtsI family protein [Dissulfurispiraceae bacterium]|jgi:cell division protein FtsI/penicillin-binding protein 2